MHKRNRWMVDQSDQLLALWDGIERGGTWNCVAYAQDASHVIHHVPVPQSWRS